MLNGALALACVVTIQAGLGIVTLLHQAPLPLALLHQATAHCGADCRRRSTPSG